GCEGLFHGMGNC
nr:sperm-activating peptide V [Brissus agassizii]